MCDEKGMLGIFSRDDRSCYQWLSQSLQDSSLLQSVNHCYISNDFSEFQKEVRNCTFAILYHTKNRGRLNLIGVTDSLYDVELLYLHQMLGKSNVIVVIDNVDDSEDAKSQILEQQPSILKLADDLFLFSDNDNRTYNSGDIENSPLLTSSNKERKLKQIFTKVKAHNRRLGCKRYHPLVAYILVLLMMLVLGLFVFGEIPLKL